MITAAHCQALGPVISVVLGEHDISGVDDQDTNRYLNSINLSTETHQLFSFRKVVNVVKTIPHPNFQSPLSLSNDVALLMLAEDVDLNTHTPACLPESGKDYTGKTGSVYGENILDFFYSEPF